MSIFHTQKRVPQNFWVSYWWLGTYHLTADVLCGVCVLPVQRLDAQILGDKICVSQSGTPRKYGCKKSLDINLGILGQIVSKKRLKHLRFFDSSPNCLPN